MSASSGELRVGRPDLAPGQPVADWFHVETVVLVVSAFPHPGIADVVSRAILNNTGTALGDVVSRAILNNTGTALGVSRAILNNTGTALGAILNNTGTALGHPE